MDSLAGCFPREVILRLAAAKTHIMTRTGRVHGPTLIIAIMLKFLGHR